ncbi:TIGR04063 family PEP-CTERM/XrtA system glycosyltransferase [Porphyrobacter sp. CACIAM 03H1]|uniref:TIGR04063 family PEP-CTERM/XrtA system glycosyltransferase n=1 Tax=Porphyrobacter sp. CACIAM 03H1 TaxID=2003315 RepID=UPI000B5A95D4|nr:TIGR04063 family PEP-CTERM/XrtA system glycosyltransferase [Porphyrobacter sp. CACIAM 03H1]ASJ91033.1 glycosyltransferase, exosortase A system-associated [Porphyrobacter sp. CACIAM 03H1]
MTRVLHVLDHSLPLHSGYTFRTRAILKAQEGHGLEVRGITGQRHNLEAAVTGAREKADGLVFHRTPGTPSGPPALRELGEIEALASAIIAMADEWRPDIIHAHSPALCGAAAERAARALGVPFVYEIRAFWEDAAVGNLSGTEGNLKYRLTRALETRVARSADALFTICHGLKDDLAARGIPADRIRVMPNGVDLTLFGDPPPRDAALAAELGIGPQAPVIGYIGSFYAYEGVDDLIAAMPLLRRTHPDARLLLVGAGPMDAAWRAAAAALPEPEAVIFAGRVPHSAVERYYSLVDVLAYPRKAQRLTDLVTPLKPLEAMAQRRLVAASSVGGHRELIADGITGTLFAPDDPAACAAALARLLEARGAWEAIKDRALAHVRERHDWALNARDYLSVYHLLLAGADSGGATRLAASTG